MTEQVPNARYKKATDKEWLKGRSKHVSAFCSKNQHPLDERHEGQSVKSYRGTPMKTCDLWLDCPCNCHYEIDKMCELAGMERVLPEQSAEYVAHHSALVMETQLMLDALEHDVAVLRGRSNSVGVVDPSGDEGPVATPADAPSGTLETGDHGIVEPRFDPTPTGRRARGQLEFDVLKICDEYAHDVYDWEYCTPKLVAERIGKVNETEPPSTGAINAVWDRWEKLGFAKQDKKPSRFVCFEMDGSLQTLEMLKRRQVKDKKRIKSDMRRGVRPPKPR